MMLQSLVENSIKHGIEPKPEGGKVRVAAGIHNAQLWVEVSDTGVGVPDGDLLDGPTSGTGIGLQYIRERLAVLYPGKSRIMLKSDPATGTVVRISVPYQVGPDVAAADAQEAVDKADALRPDVVFLDIRMPGLTGLEAAREIVTLPSWSGEIVFVTAYDEYDVAAFEQGALDYLLKPLDALLEKLLNAQQSMGRAAQQEPPVLFGP